MADAPPATASLTFDAAPGELGAALHWVYETCERLGAAESECLSLRLAVEEVCTNLIAYGHGGRGGPIALGIAHTGIDPLGGASPGEDRSGGDPVKGDLVVTICYRSPPFHRDATPPSHPGAGVEERRIDGIGGHLVKGLMDEVRYDTRGGSNRLTLVKHLTRQC